MNFTETIKLALAAIWSHKLRSFLTLLGMIIGVTAFMVVFSVLQGFNSYIDEKIAGIGSNSFTIQRFNFEDFKDSDSIAEAQRRNKEFTLDDLEYLRSRAVVIDKIGAKAGGNRREIKAGANSMCRKAGISRRPKTITRCGWRLSEPTSRTNSSRRAERSDRKLRSAAFPTGLSGYELRKVRSLASRKTHSSSFH
jgi:hypothetical protein